MLLALVWQSVAVQTHRHGHALARVAAAGAAAWAAPDRGALDDGDCPLCAERADAGQYLDATPPVLSPPAPPTVFTRALLAVRWRSIAARSHDWDSRGPPAVPVVDKT